MPADEKIQIASSSGGSEIYRWGELMQELNHLSKLQEDASHAQIDARQKRREASFRRQDVWFRDADFMRYVQQLSAQGRFDGFEDLAKLADKCQIARDELGPVEQEGIEADQKWEGQLWELQRAEERIYNDYQDEFREAATYSPGFQSAVSSESKHPAGLLESDLENVYPNIIPPTPEQLRTGFTTSLPDRQLVPMKTDPMKQSHNFKSRDAILLDLVESTEKEVAVSSADPLREWDSDSGIADIDRIPRINTNEDLAHSFQKLPSKQFSSLQLYPQLLNDFGSTRERVNKWLENTTLVSRFEGISLYTILKDQLERENALLPTNWAQLVIAYWDLDGASIPQVRQKRKNEAVGLNEDQHNVDEKSKWHTEIGD
jgi:hypothetical protein